MIYSYLSLLKSSIENVIYYLITYILTSSKLLRVLLSLRDNRVRARFNLLDLEILAL